MERPAPKESNSSEKPPRWWHDAIRNNMPGNMVTPDRFETYEEKEDRFTYIVYSLTANDPSTGNSEGIFIDTTIPNNATQEESNIMILPVLQSISYLFVKESQDKGLQEHTTVKPEVNQELADLGLEMNSKPLTIKVYEQSKGTLLFSLVPANADKLDPGYKLLNNPEDIKNMLFEKFFRNLDYFSRIRYESNPAIKVALKRELLKKEVSIGKVIVETIMDDPDLSRQDLENLVNDEEAKNHYKKYMEEILNATPDDNDLLIAEMRDMSQVMKAGWFEFYQKYWEDKLGEKLT